MSLLITKQGIFSTVQDMGRVGYRAFGVNPNGVMDRSAAKLLNGLLENDETAPVLELHFPAGEYIFEKEIVFAIGGAEFSAELSSTPVANWASYQASEGDVLKFTKKRSGNRAYLAVRGGFNVEDWLSSASTSLVTGKGGFQGRTLKTGDRLLFRSQKSLAPSTTIKIGRSIIPSYSSSPRLRVTAGPEFEILTGLSQQILFSEQFDLSQRSDRMGFRLNGSPLCRLSDDEILSSGTTFGTIQLLHDGQMIVLMADHQTIGGYPRIATIASVDLPLIAQLGPGDGVSFELIALEDAENLTLGLENEIAYLRVGVRARNRRV